MTVQFSPTGSGDFTGSLRLAVGTVTKVVPIAATSRTVAEFLQMLSGLNNPMSSVGDYYPTLYVENVGYQLDMILAGFAQLNEEDLNNWLNLAPNLGGSGTMPDPQLVEALRVLESIGAEIAGWLSQLAQAVQENRFDAVYDSLLTQGFSQIEQAFMVLLGTSNPSDARNFFLLQDPYFRQSADSIRNITGMPVIFFYRQSGQLYHTCSHNCRMLNDQEVPVKIIMVLACYGTTK